MIKNVYEIKSIRMNLGITQKGLAEISDVSQSFIAKIESGLIDPGFSKAIKIIEALEGKVRDRKLCADEIMQKDIFFVKPDDLCNQVTDIMKKQNISQVPVKDKDQVMGVVTERSLLGTSGSCNVKDVMESPPPVVCRSTNVDVIIQILKHSSMVLVNDKGKIAGIVTKSDVIGV
ncbi:MAG: CBS domain-containing protein [Nanobdellota archaeon]